MTVIKLLKNVTPRERRAILRLNHGSAGKMRGDLDQFFAVPGAKFSCKRCGWLLMGKVARCPECGALLTARQQRRVTGREKWVILKKDPSGLVLAWALAQEVRDSYSAGKSPYMEIQVYVPRSRRRRGHGGRLVACAKRLAKRQRLTPKVYLENAPEFFRGLGFTKRHAVP